MSETEILQQDLTKRIFSQISSQIRLQGLKQKDLAEEFGVSEQEYSRAIHGNPTPKARRLRELTYKKLGMN